MENVAEGVRVWGAKGRPATPTYKISATYMDGYKVGAPTYKISATYMDGYKVGAPTYKISHLHGRL
jgi:hypothetical protein